MKKCPGLISSFDCWGNREGRSCWLVGEKGLPRELGEEGQELLCSGHRPTVRRGAVVRRGRLRHSAEASPMVQMGEPRPTHPGMCSRALSARGGCGPSAAQAYSSCCSQASRQPFPCRKHSLAELTASPTWPGMGRRGWGAGACDRAGIHSLICSTIPGAELQGERESDNNSLFFGGLAKCQVQHLCVVSLDPHSKAISYLYFKDE